MDEELDYGTREGRGREYGVLIHHLFEEAVLGRLPQEEGEYVRRLVRESGLDAGLGRDARGALERFRSSSLWEEIRRADQVFTEVPLGRFEHVPGGSGIVRGVIDLAYRLHGSWKIVDFKTDAAATADEVAALRRKYEPQLREYAACWEEIAGASPSSAVLWFVHAPEIG